MIFSEICHSVSSTVFGSWLMLNGSSPLSIGNNNTSGPRSRTPSPEPKQQIKRTRCGTVIQATNRQCVSLAAPPPPCDGSCVGRGGPMQRCQYCKDLAREVLVRSRVLAVQNGVFVNHDHVCCRIAINTRLSHESYLVSSTITPSSSSSATPVFIGRNYGYHMVQQQEEPSNSSSSTSSYRFYCGRNVGRRNYHNQCSRCDGRCGPANSCQCRGCYALEQQYLAALARNPGPILMVNETDSNTSFPSHAGTTADPSHCGNTFCDLPKDQPSETDLLIKNTMESLLKLQSFQDCSENTVIIEQLKAIVDVKQVYGRLLQIN